MYEIETESKTEHQSDGEELAKDGDDYKLIVRLLEMHPRGKEKAEGMKGLKIDVSTQGGNRCFYVLKEDGKAEDFSMMKIYTNIECNPELTGASTSLA